MLTPIESYDIPVIETLFLNNRSQFYSSLCLYPISLSSWGERLSCGVWDSPCHEAYAVRTGERVKSE